ncbi:hypothetical protein H101_08177, partial [Trichophyton interdigitale H6]
IKTRVIETENLTSETPNLISQMAEEVVVMIKMTGGPGLDAPSARKKQLIGELNERETDGIAGNLESIVTNRKLEMNVAIAVSKANTLIGGIPRAKAVMIIPHGFVMAIPRRMLSRKTTKLLYETGSGVVVCKARIRIRTGTGTGT